jgi:hypothetical protein
MSSLYERHKLNNAIKINKRPLGAEKSSRDLFSHRSSRCNFEALFFWFDYLVRLAVKSHLGKSLTGAE